MDKKELNDLIDRVVLTGPGGVDKIKKILKELVIESDGSGSDDSSGCKCLAPMVVEGTVDENNIFFPSDDAPSFKDAYGHMMQGGIVYLLIMVNGEPLGEVLAMSVSAFGIQANIGEITINWPNSGPDSDEPSEPVVW